MADVKISALPAGTDSSNITLPGNQGAVNGPTSRFTTGVANGLPYLDAAGKIGPTSAMSLYATLASPTFSGIPAAPTAIAGTSTTQLATTEFVQSAITAFGVGNPPNVAFWATASTIGSNIFFTYSGAGDATGSFLGIGVATPLEKLHVVGNQILTGQSSIGGSAQAGLVSGTQRYVDIAETITDFTPSNSWRLFGSRVIVDPDADYTADTVSSSFAQVSIPGTNANDFGNLIAHIAITSHAGSGALSQNIARTSSATLSGAGSIVTNAVHSITAQAVVGSAGTITNNYCDVYNSGTQSAGSSITNNFVQIFRTPRTDGPITTHRAIYAEDQNGATTSHFIYSEGGQSYHAGNFGIDNDAPPAPLTISDNIYAGTTYDGNGGWGAGTVAIELTGAGGRSSWQSVTETGTKFGTETNSALYFFTNQITAITIANDQTTDFTAQATFESNIVVNGRILGAMGVVTAANDITLPAAVGNVFSIGSSAVPVNTISLTGWTPGSVVILLCTSTFAFHHNTAGAGGLLLLAGSVDFNAVPGCTLTLLLDGTDWQEIARKTP